MKRERGMIIILALLFSFVSFASAIDVGVSPATINFEKVLRNGYSEKYVLVTSNSEEPVTINLTFRGEILGWVNSSIYEFNLTKSQPARLLLELTPPEDAPNGNYTGFMRIEIKNKLAVPEENQQAVGTIQTVLDLAINVEVVDYEIISCLAEGFSVNSVERGDPIEIGLSVENRGNILLSTTLESKIWDQEQTEIVKTEYAKSQIIKPTRKEPVYFNIPTNDLDVGQYWLEITSLECTNTQILTFDVLEPGALSSQGVIKSILAPVWTDADETTNISVIFENTGLKNYEARFEGKITLDGKIVLPLQSEKFNVRVGEEFPFQFYFTPKKEGRYLVSGRVFYDGKRTFEKSAVINVRSSGLNLAKLTTYLIYLILIIIASYIMYRIAKERREFTNKFR